ncbi:MAG: hypothetical protein PHV33_12000 [Elusimicrobiales bacterium]|nr:hypothetical protein [Elusimicrobiales bacterium]
MITLIRAGLLPLLLLFSFIHAAGRSAQAEGLGSIEAFKALEAAFPGQFSASKVAAELVEFCPDNTCYAFERARGVSYEELTGFIYLYLFYSSDYAYTEAWQNKPESAILAKTIAAKLGPRSCRAFAGGKAGLCVMNSMMAKKAVKVYDVRYDENERSVVPVPEAALSRTGAVFSCREFTDAFLAWYVPLALRGSKKPASVIAIRQRPSLFSDRLRDALAEDRKAQEQSTDGIVGIDFDPFLSAQDPAEKYYTAKVTVEEGKCLADIKPAGAERDWDVRAEAKRPGGAWRFTNFHYNTDVLPNDLLSILRDLKRGRSAVPAKRAGK